MPRLLKLMGYGMGLVVSTVYLLNPTAGVLELVPDNLPIIGHLDEAAAVGLFLATVRGLRSLRSHPPRPGAGGPKTPP